MTDAIRALREQVEAGKPCSGCGKITTGMCWTDCGMSLCGAPLCDGCHHVDAQFGWRHEPRALEAQEGGE